MSNLAHRTVTSALVAALVGGGATLVAPLSARAADASTATTASSGRTRANAGGPITRAEILSRARRWVDQKVPYNQKGYTSDGIGQNYRTDCSGFVTMSWHANGSYWTGSVLTISHVISKKRLQPGDGLLKTGHAALFVRWANKERTAAVVYEQGGNARYAHQTTYGVARLAQFHAIRYNQMGR